MTGDYNIVLLDGNSLGYANQHATALTCNGMQVQAIYGFIRSIRDVRMEHPAAKIRVLWDGRAQHRFNLYPEYKSNRRDTPDKIKLKEAYETQKPYIHRMLGQLGVEQVHYTNLEADDLAGYFAGKLRGHPKARVKLITGDGDWLQLIGPNVHWFDPGTKLRASRLITLDNLFDETGYKTPFALLEGKCLMGDTSDKITGVGGIGEKGAPEFLAEFGSVTAFWKQVDAGTFKPIKKAHQGLASPEGRALFKRNLGLMQLMRPPAPQEANRIVYPCGYDRAAFQTECEDLNFLSITARMDLFLSPFESMKEAA